MSGSSVASSPQYQARENMSAFLPEMLQADLLAFGRFEIDSDRTPTPCDNFEAGALFGILAVYPHHISAEVRQQHTTERGRTVAAEFDYLDA
jgi:hypothetical protein